MAARGCASRLLHELAPGLVTWECDKTAIPIPGHRKRNCRPMRKLRSRPPIADSD